MLHAHRADLSLTAHGQSTGCASSWWRCARHWNAWQLAQRGWVVFCRLSTPKAIRNSGVSRLTKTLTDIGVRNAVDRQRCRHAAKAQTVRLPGQDVAAGLVAELAQGVIALDDRIKATDADIEGRFRRHRLAEVITSMPGSGFVSAPTSWRHSVIPH